MGIDAVMYVRVPRALTDEEIAQASYAFGAAFRSALFLGYEDKIVNRPLARIDPDTAACYDIALDPLVTVLDVPLGGRYYGPDYERGNLFEYVGAAELLERLFPGCEVLYGGDSGVVEPFDRVRRESFIEHFIAHQRRPYINGYGQQGPDHVCPTCGVTMTRNGWGGNDYGHWFCDGCGWAITTRDGQTQRGFGVE